MKIAFFSSVLNHHQIEFCDEMYKKYGDDFTFVSTMEMEEQRKKLKYSEFDRPYNLKMYINEDCRQKGEELFQDADVVILGVLMEKSLRRRLIAGKITFLYKERLFKEKPSAMRFVRSLLYVAREYWAFRNKPFYMLAASAYSHRDFKSLGIFGKKTFAWGYFPPLKEYDENLLINNKKSDILNIFWAGRFLEWKNPLYLIDVAKTLKISGIPFHIDVAGNGPVEEDFKKMVSDNKLDDVFTLHGALPQEEIRGLMEKANIYLFTSNRQEGFGVVLSEAMNSGCAVVASATAGSTNLLVKNDFNGRIYENDSSTELCEIVLDLAKNPEKCEELGLQAYKTMRDCQNAVVAAERFSQVVTAIAENKNPPDFRDGPMRKIR